MELVSQIEPETVCERFQRFLRIAEVGKYRIKGNLANCNLLKSKHIVLINEEFSGPFRNDEIVNNVTISECNGDPCGLYIRKYHQFPYSDQ